MNERNVAVGLLLFVILAFGGLIFYDVKVGHKFEKLLGKEKVANNWKWEDNWDGKGPTGPGPGPDRPSPTPPPVDVPGPQLIAGSYTEAVKKSGEVGKPVLAFFTADWCQWCKKMKSETMSDSKVQAALKSYIVVYVDTDKDRAPARKFGVESLPSYVITNAKEEKLKADGGFKNADSFASWLNNPSLFNQPRAEAQPQPTPPPPDPKSQPDRNGPFRRRQQPPPQPTNPNMRPGNPPVGPPQSGPG